MSPRGEKKTGGRPPIAEELKRVTLNCRVSPETKQWLDSQKTVSEKSIGEIVDLAIEGLKNNSEELPSDLESEEIETDD